MPFPDLAKSPVDGFFDEVALVGGIFPDERKELEELLVGRFLVVDGQAGHHDESRPAHEFLTAFGPLPRFLVGPGSFVEKIGADLVADVPGIKIFDPAFHLFNGDLLIVVDKARQKARFVYLCFPQLLCQPMVLAYFLGQRTEDGDAYAKGILWIDAEPCHAGCISRVGFFL